MSRASRCAGARLQSRARIRRQLRASAACWALFGGAPLALAADPAPSQAAAAAPLETAAPASEVWYGSQTLLADGASLLLLVAGIAVNDQDTGNALTVGAGLAFLVGGPVVHLVNGGQLTSLGSLGLRAGLPLAGGLVGSALGNLAEYDDGDEVVRGAAFGVLGGVLTAVIVDAAALAWRPVPKTAAASPPGTLTWRPRLTLTEARAQLSILGEF